MGEKTGIEYIQFDPEPHIELFLRLFTPPIFPGSVSCRRQPPLPPPRRSKRPLPSLNASSRRWRVDSSRSRIPWLVTSAASSCSSTARTRSPRLSRRSRFSKTAACATFRRPGAAAPRTDRPMDFPTWMFAVQRRTETALALHLPGVVSAAAPERLDALACAVEFIHVYSLVHDDLPCMDDDALRRGKPACHVEFDEATALLVGDALQALAFAAIAAPGCATDAAAQLAMIEMLAQAAGSRGMAGGQAIDLAAVGRQLSLEELELMHIRKTGALIRASVLLGALAGEALGESQLECLDNYAKRIGLLFQVVDDILDSAADTATLGKTAGKDAARHKPTYVSLIGVERARELADELCAEAGVALAGFDGRADRLRQLAAFIVSRQF